LTFYGNETVLEPQRLLGSVVRTLHSRPVLQQDIIQKTVEDSSHGYLRNSDLAQELELVKFMPLALSTEDLSKIWSIFFQTPYTLSIAYQASAVLIESEDIPRRALPVRQPKVKAISIKPVINQIVSLDELTKVWHSSPDKPILANSTINIRGQRLQGELTQVRIGTTDAIPQQVNQKQITLNLASVSTNTLRPGVQGIQVIHRNSTNSHRLVESNVMPFILLPAIAEVRVTNVEGRGGELRSAQITVSTNPYIGKSQRVVLLLNEASTVNPAEYTFKVPLREADTDAIATSVRAVKPGEYLVRLQVDGVESLLTVDTDSESPTFEQFIAPKITIF
jgi:hypothetical protein